MEVDQAVPEVAEAENNAQFSPIPHHMRGMNKTCIHCGAKYFEEELNSQRQYHKCCMGGTITLDLFQPPPPNVRHLYSGDTNESRYFLQHFRQYNALMAMASWKANIVRHPNRGPPVITIHGNAYHLTGN